MDTFLPTEIVKLIDYKVSRLVEDKKVDALILVVTHLFANRDEEWGSFTDVGNLKSVQMDWFVSSFTLVCLKRLCKRMKQQVAYGDGGRAGPFKGFHSAHYFTNLPTK
uniref:Uncharacterized protein n=1 Tax=Clandestinovirus TaxID=2831644 RepID=A0A8F8KQQ3_9VIRU|nr:hypothetical protein KOM_12_170 [Clandestinovirus]